MDEDKKHTAEGYTKVREQDKEIARLRAEIENIKSGEVVKEKTENIAIEDKKIAADDSAKSQEQDKEIAK